MPLDISSRSESVSANRARRRGAGRIPPYGKFRARARNKPLVLGLIAIEFIRRISSVERLAERVSVNPH
jgi:hypothetical protein